MRVVSDTSPVSNLAIIGRLEFLRLLHGEVFIPPAVEMELSQLRHDTGCMAVKNALEDGWLRVVLPEVPRPTLPGLHVGEIEAIQLALGTADSLLLLDESEGRASARGFGLRISGVIGVLILAKKHGWIDSLEKELLALRTQARFFISPNLLSKALAEVGEVGH
jgi:predicted nucleic acid-binding protein